ncbi:2'-5' RNA ligase family protein [Clostridium sp. MSJ-11]|uniref:2'-5' RNA ligase family protein n=1 Tax=Clostridium mobile TaxID=2841512 RepID=A0ABS6EM54_9CLOT|nr:2'-5' RNA ligase family protein [Clostridium mobile]MBU5486299.1 2'-5' RNA ligase family protein [Clostridium mobile]
MKYYLVALFDEESYKYMEGIQRSICRKYKLYKNMPMLHITLEIIDDPDIEELSRIVNNIISPYKKFKVMIDGAICFDPPYKSVNLKLQNKGYISRLARKINDTLKLSNFKVRDNIDNWDLHISLANTNYAQREWNSREYLNACEMTKGKNVKRTATIERIELWKPINNRKEMVVKSFPLREF